MDGKDIQSDLRALKRLYGLLRNDVDGTSNTHSDLLDEHSKFVLKNLLDAETKRLLLKVHSEVVAGPPKENQSCEQGKDMEKDSKMDGLDVLAQKRCMVCQRSTVKSIHSDNDGVVAINSSNALTDMQKNESDHRLWNSKQGSKSNNEWSDESNSDKGGQGVPYASNYGDTEATSSKSDCLPKASEALKQIELCVSDEQLQELFEKSHLVPEIKSSAMLQQYGEDNFMTTSSLLSSQRDVNPLCFPMYYWVPPYLSLSQTCKMFEPNKAMVRQSSTNNLIRPALESDMSGESRDECKFSTKKGNKKVYSENAKAMRDETESRKWKRSPISRNRRLQRQESDSCEQSSSPNSDSEEYSSTDDTGELQCRSSSSRSSESCGGSTGAQYSSSFTSNSDEQDYSSSSGDGAAQMTPSSSKSEGSTPKKPGPNRIHRAHINHKKQFGVWKRLKDRLAIVFHHHHHHHHGHRTNDEAKMSHSASLGKRQGKRQDEAYKEKADGRIKKSVVHGKGQRSHFHGLVEGLLRHVGHSKQSKLAKGTEKRNGTNKTLNKSHWWQLLQHHHRGAKFPKTSHVKHRLGKEKARFKALPKVE